METIKPNQSIFEEDPHDANYKSRGMAPALELNQVSRVLDYYPILETELDEYWQINNGATILLAVLTSIFGYLLSYLQQYFENPQKGLTYYFENIVIVFLILFIILVVLFIKQRDWKKKILINNIRRVSTN